MLHGSPGGYDSGLFLAKQLSLPGGRVIAPKVSHGILIVKGMAPVMLAWSDR